jgi:hypothetical protein
VVITYYSRQKLGFCTSREIADKSIMRGDFAPKTPGNHPPRGGVTERFRGTNLQGSGDRSDVCLTDFNASHLSLVLHRQEIADLILQAAGYRRVGHVKLG